MEATQGALFRLERWSEYRCLSLKPSKCKATFLSLDPHQTNFQFHHLLFNSRLRFNPSSTFLGVTFHRTFSFSKPIFAEVLPLSIGLTLYFCFLVGLSKESLCLLYKALFGPFALVLHPDGFLKRYQYHQIGMPSPAASRPPLSHVFSLRRLYRPFQVTLTHFTFSTYEQALRLPISIFISSLAGLGMKPRYCRSSWRAFASIHQLMLPCTSPIEALFFALPHLGTCLPHCAITLSSPCSRSNPPSLAKMRLSLTLTVSPLTICC